eukprot:1178094-Prorocentrum_minimum.AAC.8
MPKPHTAGEKRQRNRSDRQQKSAKSVGEKRQLKASAKSAGEIVSEIAAKKRRRNGLSKRLTFSVRQLGGINQRIVGDSDIKGMPPPVPGPVSPRVEAAP